MPSNMSSGSAVLAGVAPKSDAYVNKGTAMPDDDGSGPHTSWVVAKPTSGVSAPEKQVNRLLAMSVLSMLLVLGGQYIDKVLYYPAVPILAYVFFVMSFKYVRTAVRDGKVPLALMDIIGNGGPLITGNIFASAFLSTSYYLAQKLMLWTEDHSRKGLVSIFGEQPRSVVTIEDGKEVEIPFEQLGAGKHVVVHAGWLIPADGKIIEGIGQFDERALTGEAQPMEKAGGESVFAGTVLLAGRVVVEVDKAGKDSVAAQIAESLNATADFKSGLQSRGETIMNRGAVPTLLLSVVALWLKGTDGFLAMFFAAFGYHMRFAAPISVLIYLRLASENGILVKDGRSLEQLSLVDTVVFDKTGTLTEDQPEVCRIKAFGIYAEETVLVFAAAAEARQNHPIARAIVAAAASRGLQVSEVAHTRYDVGRGLVAQVDQDEVVIGSPKLLMANGIHMPVAAIEFEEECAKIGTSLVYLAISGELSGIIELRSIVRKEVAGLIGSLKQRGLSCLIISGDRQAQTRELAQGLGIDRYFAETLPEDKARIIKTLQTEGRKVCFIGDGINDSIALKSANVSVSLTGANAVATDVAGVILMDGTLRRLEQLFALAKSLDSNLKASTVLSFVPGIICVVGVFAFDMRLVTAIWVYNIGLGVSVLNAASPWLISRVQSRWAKFRKRPLNTYGG